MIFTSHSRHDFACVAQETQGQREGKTQGGEIHGTYLNPSSLQEK